ncbi:MAG: phosphoglycerol geranylgeranyltransferase [Thermoplasmataceae archaeon]
MTVYENIMKKLLVRKIHMTLIDPATSGPEGSAEIAHQAAKAGTDFIMLGGSTEISPTILDESVKLMKERIGLEVILFPGSSSMISKRADAIYFMSLLNSADIEFIVGHQKKAALFLNGMVMEKIAMGYLIFQPGMTAGRVGKAMLIDREDTTTALQYSLAAEYFGMKLVYFEAGSGADRPVSTTVISKAKEKLSIPLIVGGGIRDANTAEHIAKAGADIIVTGTVAEKASDVFLALKPIIDTIHSVRQN